MSDENFNLSMRKFLKKLGVTGQQAIEKAVREAVASGDLQGDKLPVKATITIKEIGLEHEIEDTIDLTDAREESA